MNQFELGRTLAGGPAFLILGTDAMGDDSTMNNYGWSGVYTSRVDSEIADGFVTPTRTVQRIGAMRSVPTRGTQELEIRHLFGGLLLPEGELPGADPVSRASRRITAIQEISRLASETITPRGVIVVEGWGESDPLHPDDLLPIFLELAPGQVHVFSASSLRSHEFMKALVQRDLVILHDETLDSALAQLMQSGALPSRPGTAQSAHVIPVEEKFVPVDVSIWNEIRRSARPIDLETLRPPSFSSSASRYREFRAFMGATDGVPRWSGIAAGFNLRRDFEAQLDEAVFDALEDPSSSSPIIVQGQTSSGKSIALAALAARTAASGRAAVLHQSRRTARPSFDDIERFAQWSEEQGANAVLFVWDGMADPSEYETMSRRLHARGRRTIIVGSSYRSTTLGTGAINAPASLSDGEFQRITALLESFGIIVSQGHRSVDSSFLGFLYRALPETEYTLRHGLAAEMRAAERGLFELASSSVGEQSLANRTTALQAAFAAAGYNPLSSEISALVSDSKLYDTNFEDRSAIQRVTTLVIVAGRYGLPVPIDLALRILGREGSQSIRTALSSNDIIRDEEDGTGELSLTVRSRLEANLLAQHEIPLAVEAEVVESIIANLRVTSDYSVDDEVSFLVQLLGAVGPNGRDSDFRPFFYDFAEALRMRRELGGVSSPRLVLQESVLIRSHVYLPQTKNSTSIEERVLLLEHNRDMLHDSLAEDSVRGLIRVSLLVELASTLGAITHELSSDPDANNDSSGLTSRLGEIFAAVKESLAIDPTDVHTIDVLAWATRDALESGALSDAERLDRTASVLAMVDSVSAGSISDANRAQLDERSATLEGLLNNDDAVWRHLESLELNEDPAATYLLARFDARGGDEGEARALERLETSSVALEDWRCAGLLLNLAWKRATKSVFLQGERVPLYMNFNEASYLRGLFANLDSADLPDKYRLSYAKALVEFVAGNYVTARREFQTTQEATRQLTRRLHTTNLIADESRDVKIYSGRVQWSRGRGGELWVNELGTTVRFDPLRFFASGEVAENQSIPRFTLGFKLSTGVVAEPVGFQHGGRR